MIPALFGIAMLFVAPTLITVTDLMKWMGSRRAMAIARFALTWLMVLLSMFVCTVCDAPFWVTCAIMWFAAWGVGAAWSDCATGTVDSARAFPLTVLGVVCLLLSGQSFTVKCCGLVLAIVLSLLGGYRFSWLGGADMPMLRLGSLVVLASGGSAALVVFWLLLILLVGLQALESLFNEGGGPVPLAPAVVASGVLVSLFAVAVSV